MKKVLTYTTALISLLVACTARSEEGVEAKPYNQLFFGLGTSYPGWGDTTERVQTFDIIYRHCRPFSEKTEGRIKGSHEFWIEVPMSIIVSDSDREDANDIGFFGLNCLFAWVFPETQYGSPYFMLGGGPVYVAADVNGVGSDLCGNYQAGGGFRLNVFQDRPINLELRYHHISNLNMKSPNIAINSTKVFCGLTLPF